MTLLDERKVRARNWFETLRDDVCAAFEALEDALEDYEGSVLLISHDRAFLREVATRVWFFDGTHLKDFDGPFVEWEETRARRGRRLGS